MKKTIMIPFVLAVIALFIVGCQPGGQATRQARVAQFDDYSAHSYQPAPQPSGEVGIWEWIEDPPGSGQWKLVDTTAVAMSRSPEQLIPGQTMNILITPDLIKQFKGVDISAGDPGNLKGLIQKLLGLSISAPLEQPKEAYLVACYGQQGCYPVDVTGEIGDFKGILQGFPTKKKGSKTDTQILPSEGILGFSSGESIALPQGQQDSIGLMQYDASTNVWTVVTGTEESFETQAGVTSGTIPGPKLCKSVQIGSEYDMTVCASLPGSGSSEAAEIKVDKFVAFAIGLAAAALAAGVF